MNGFIIQWNHTSCTDEQVARATSVVDDTSAERTEVMAVARSFADETERLHSSAVKRAQARLEYDRAYLDNKTASIRGYASSVAHASEERIRAVREALSRVNASLHVDSIGMGNPLVSVVASMRNRLERIHAFYENQKFEMLNFHAAAMRMQEYLHRLQRLADEHIAALDPNFKVEAISLPEIHLGEVSLVHVPNPLGFAHDLESFERARAAEARQRLSDISKSLSLWRDEFSIGITEIAPPDLLADYEPPPLNLSDAVLAMRAKKGAFLQRHASVVDRFSHPFGSGASGPINSTDSSHESLYFNVSALSQFSLQGGKSTFSYEPLIGANMSIVALFELSVSRIVDLATVADTAWRMYTSVRLVVQYWYRTDLGIPPLDLRLESLRRDVISKQKASSAMKGFISQLARFSPWRSTVSILLSPITAISVFAGLSCMVINAAAGIYMHAFYAYVNGCVQPPQNGTFFTANLYSFAYDYATVEGDHTLSAGLERLHERGVANCTSYFQSSLREHREASTSLSATVDGHNDAAKEMALLRNCLLVGKAFGGETSKTTNLSPLLETKLKLYELLRESSSSCGENVTYTMEDAVYRCEALPECQPTCDGPSAELIRIFTTRCGCYVEWLLHGSSLFVLLTVFVFACMNLSRYFAVEALCRIFWKHLYEGSFGILASCKSDVYGSAHSDFPDCLSFGAGDIDAAVRASTQSIRKRGVWMFLMALSLNFAWVFALHWVVEGGVQLVTVARPFPLE